jgi:Zn finger protein HypA/HybF involved in hydrogenase expression
MSKSTVCSAVFVALFLRFSSAHAQGLTKVSAADAGDEVTQLMQIVDQTAINLSTCDDACRALQTMLRAAERICAIEPGGARCESARAKTDASRARVLTACPTCTVEEPHVARAAQEPSRPESAKESQAGATAVDANAPRRGGCAGCATSTGADNGWLLVLAAFVLSQRRRRG